MNKKRKKTIGFQINNLQGRYAAKLWPLIVAVAKRYDINLIIFPGHAFESPYGYESKHNAIYNFINKHNVDGLIMASGAICNFIGIDGLKNYYEKLKGMPIVSLGIKLDGIPSILVDNKFGLKNVVDHLIEHHKYKKIAFVRGTRNNPEAEERFAAYKESLIDHKMKINNDLIVQGNFHPDSGNAAVKILMDERRAKLEAIVVANDDMALGVLEELKKRKIDVPNNVAVVGFDNIEEVQFHEIPLTTVDQPLDEQAEIAFEILMKMFKGKTVPDQIILPTRLIVRSSCGCISGMDTLVNNQLSLNNKTLQKKTIYNEKSRNVLFDSIEKLIGRMSIDKDTALNWIDSIINSLSSKKVINNLYSIHLKKLNESLNSEVTLGHDLPVWQGILTMLYNYIISMNNTSDNFFEMENFFQRARIIVAEKMQQVQAIRRMQVDTIIFYLMQVISKLITTLNIEELMAVLRNELIKLDIHGAYLVLYPSEITNTDSNEWQPTEFSELVLAYSDDKDINLNAYEAIFQTSNLLPDDVLKKDKNYIMIIKSLFFRNDQIGYVIFELGSMEGIVYETLQSQISNTLKSSALIKARIDAEARLVGALNELEDSNRKLHNQSHRDELTGLYNRRGFLSLAEHNMNLALRMKQSGIVFFIDLDGLKDINDLFGHNEGDLAIKATANILSSTFRKVDIVSRLGGDEFMIFAINIPANFYKTVKKRLYDLLVRFNNISDKPYDLSFSLGAEGFSENETRSILKLMSEADKKLYREKKSKKGKKK
ncbi:MAG: GGDEF domain-containing protein [Spirochaetes bacterium]|nr:GGDEF domain-containing protein [Spirochaetota bacterium]